MPRRSVCESSSARPAVPSRARGRARRRIRRRRRLLTAALAGAALLAVFALRLSGEAAGGDGGGDIPSGPVVPIDAFRPGEGVEPSFSGGEGNNTGSIPVPDWITQDYLPVNEYSRPGDPLPQVNGVVVHYVGNPGTTAEQNRSYFGYLAETHETYASSHFVVGIDGVIIQCVPLDEISYCSNDRNADTISIECCHPDDTGEFTAETLSSLQKLLNWLIETYDLGREDVLRHYDVSGKECPRYFYRYPEAWEAFLDGLTFPEKSQ